MKSASSAKDPWLEILAAVRVRRRQLQAAAAGRAAVPALRIRTVADFHRAPRTLQ
jgi:hypothetical protein